ncbi:MAG TPA: IS21 family transposase [Candidatus Limnocylindrales bacterium]|nr:IS21 family transposase [Candidatus Limnocylindrales bacterium]
MEILEAFDLTRCSHSAADLAGCDPKTVARYVDARDGGADPNTRLVRPMLVDRYRDKIEELVERSGGRVRADVVHERLCALDPAHPYAASERTTRRAVGAAKAAYRAGRRRTYRPWITEPGMWLQFDWGKGPVIEGRPTLLFCAWLAWSRYRVVIPTWDRTLGSLLACLDATLRQVGGAPTYALTDNEKTVTIDRIAGIGVRHPEIVAAGRHYGVEVNACVPFDPESKGGSESTVKIAKADLVPTSANLLPAYRSFGDLAAACTAFCAQVNGRVHRETGARPDDRLAIERAHLHVLPAEPYTAALGETRTVADDQTVRLGSVRYSLPRRFVGTEVWVRISGDEVVIVARTETGLAEIARHPRSTPGQPRINDAHYLDHPAGRGTRSPRPRPVDPAERAFLLLGPGAETWLIEAAASGAVRVRAKMARAVELATLVGRERVEAALATAAAAGRFAEADLASILDHLAAREPAAALITLDEAFSVQPGTGAWRGFGR